MRFGVPVVEKLLFIPPRYNHGLEEDGGLSENLFLKAILEEIDMSPELTLFFRKLTEPQSRLATLFFLHRDELFAGEESIKLPYLFWDNLPTEKVTARKYRLVETLVQLEKIKSEQALKAIPAFLKFTEEEMNEDMKDLLMFIAITIARQNESIKTLIGSEDFSFKKMKELLKDYRDLKLDFPKELPEADEQILKGKAEKLASSMLENMRTGKLVTFLEKLPYLMPDTLMAFHEETHQHLQEIFKITNLDRIDYEEAMNDLYTLKLISNVNTLFWCQNCQDQPLLLKTTSQLSPRHLRLTCPKCRKPMSVSSIFRVHDLLQQCILSKDGLLSVAVAWLLRKSKIRYEAFAHNKHEYDFICITPAEQILIECKMHRSPLSERSVRHTLEQDLKQAAEHLVSLQKTNATLSKGYVVYNYGLEEYSGIVKDVSQKYDNVQAIDYQNLDDLIESIKPS